MSAAFSIKTLDALRRTGWTADRRVGTKAYTNYLTGRGYCVSSKLNVFLSEFSGLIVKTEFLGEVVFDPIKAANYVSPEWIFEDYIPRAGEQLAPFGEWQSNVLCMTPTGKVYAGMDDFLECLGNSGVEMIEALCVSQRDPGRVVP